MAAQTEIKSLLSALGFALEEGVAGVWTKEYPAHSYRLKVDMGKEEILYGDKITLGDKTTCNFKAAENFVVLECVDRLLEKGYAPGHITLEKDYPLGHKEKGKLDILVTDADGKAYLMIECKTWGAEYDKATRKTLSKGGQLLSYFQQDKAAQYLCLYTSRLSGAVLESTYGVIKIEPEFAAATNTDEVFELWNKNLKDNGIFEADSTPYNIVIKALTKERLRPLTREDSSRIFNQFAEILRHNVVSDKPNAFNKLITLLLCKIVDEDRGEGDELAFQWLENDTNISLQKRLNDLYKIGMAKYLTKIVTDYSDEDVDDLVGISEDAKRLVKDMITELRLKKNNEFAFKEVFNDASFEENSKVLKEVIELLQPYQVRYNKKHQFLGDFFELLLNTSIKQEAGQFFTPVPVARFIINSIPLKELMVGKIEAGDSDFLPYVIDYAVGSGHFLTEAMDQMHTVVREINASGKYTKASIKKNLAKWSEDYDWAYDFVYGIEKDYRLVKTAKVSCFLNGDGLARIFNADGLANFQTDGDYKDKLKITSKADAKDNGEFEVLIANPPYSVSAFRNTLKDGHKSFELYGRLTEDSSEIECLFIERAKQLLKPGGYAGVILPSSILSNTGIYEDARAIILKYFRIVAITEFGSGTFMATGTNTVTLFLERRPNADWQKIEHAVKTFFTNTTDVTVNGMEAAFSAYVTHVYKGISLEDYVSFIQRKPNAAVLAHELMADYRKAFDNATHVKHFKAKTPFKLLSPEGKIAKLDELFYQDVSRREREKLLYFLLAYPQKTVLVKANPTGKNEAEKEFLGYEFSNRRGHEGIKPYGAKTIQEATKLYEEGTSLNPEKANTYIYNAFLGTETEVHESLQNNISSQRLVDMMNFERVEFSKSVSLAFKKKASFNSKWDLVRLGTIAEISGGGTPDTNVSEYWNGNINWATLIDTKQKYLTKTERRITEEGLKNSNARLLPVNTVIFSSRATIGDVTIAKVPTATNQGYKNFICDPLKVHYEYLYYILKHEAKSIADLSSGATYLEISKNQISEFRIPLPPLDAQQRIIAELNDIEQLEREAARQFEKAIQVILEFVSGFTDKVSINTIASLRKEKIEPQKHSEELFNYLGLEHLESGTGKVLSWKSVKGLALESTKNVFKKGDLLYGKLRPYLNKVYIAEFDGICSTDILVLPTEYPKLLKYILLSESFVSRSASLMKGVNLPRLQVNEFLHSEVLYPPANERMLAAEEIESLEVAANSLHAKLKEVKSEKEAILKKHL